MIRLPDRACHDLVSIHLIAFEELLLSSSPVYVIIKKSVMSHIFQALARNFQSPKGTCPREYLQNMRCLHFRARLLHNFDKFHRDRVWVCEGALGVVLQNSIWTVRDSYNSRERSCRIFDWEKSCNLHRSCKHYFKNVSAPRGLLREKSCY